MNITVIGAGNMGGALIHGWAKSGKLSSITISDKNEALLASFKEKYPSINITTDNVAAVKGADIQFCYVIPNIAAEFGASMSFIAKGKVTSDESLAKVKTLYDLCGDTLVVTENLVGPGMMMASCGIAYVVA